MTSRANKRRTEKYTSPIAKYTVYIRWGVNKEDTPELPAYIELPEGIVKSTIIKGYAPEVEDYLFNTYGFRAEKFFIEKV